MILTEYKLASEAFQKSLTKSFGHLEEVLTTIGKTGRCIKFARSINFRGEACTMTMAAIPFTFGRIYDV